MSKKRISVANFNAVFLDGQNELPLLSYFDTLFMPALKSGYVRESGDSTFLLLNVNVVHDKQGDYVLVGNIVKKTILEVLSDLNEFGELVEKDDHYPSAPYSTFVIYLKNHRMIFAENQKGSPSIKSFRATIKYIVDKYVRIQNVRLKNEGKSELPIPIINVVGIPTREKLEETLNKVAKINELKLKFYPLNGDGDIDYNGLFTLMTGKLRSAVGSKSGEIVLRSPENINGVIKVVAEAEGIVEPIFKVTYPDKTTTTIKNDMISERKQIDIESGDFSDEVNVSEENGRIYENNQAKIIPFIRTH